MIRRHGQCLCDVGSHLWEDPPLHLWCLAENKSKILGGMDRQSLFGDLGPPPEIWTLLHLAPQLTRCKCIPE